MHTEKNPFKLKKIIPHTSPVHVFTVLEYFSQPKCIVNQTIFYPHV